MKLLRSCLFASVDPQRFTRQYMTLQSWTTEICRPRRLFYSEKSIKMFFSVLQMNRYQSLFKWDWAGGRVSD